MKRFLILLWALFPFLLHAQQDSSSTVRNDSILRIINSMKTIEISAPRPIYSMDAGVVNYNVASDETIHGGTALDALRNAPSVDVDVEGNLTLRGSSLVEIWINGYPTHMNGQSMQIYLTALSSDVIDHIEVIKNPSAEYMVAEGTAIINIVMSAKLRRSQFLAVGLSGNNRPYVSPWAAYVYDGDKLDFNIHLAPSISHSNTFSEGSSWSLADNDNGGLDTTQSQHWTTTDSSRNYFTMLTMGLTYKIDSLNDIAFNSFSLLQGFQTHSLDDRYRNEYLPTYLPLHCTTDQDYGNLNSNGFSTLTYRHLFDRHGHNLSLTVNTNWNYTTSNITSSRIFDVYYPNELRESASQKISFDPSLTLRYRRPLGDHDNLYVGVGFAPNSSHSLVSSAYFDSTSMAYALADTLRNRTTATRHREEYLSLNWRHQTHLFSTSAGVVATAHQADYSVLSLFPEELFLNYITLKPTFNFTCHTKSMHYFSANYSFSTSHPSPSQLSQSPAYHYDSYSVGNPQLEPYITHKADVSWNKYFESGSSLSMDAYGEWNNNTIESVLDATSEPDPYLNRVVSFTTYYNIGSSYKYGLESNATYRLNAFLNFKLYANLYYAAYQIDYPKTGLYSDSALTYNLRLSCNAKLFKKVFVDLSGNYTSPTVNPFVEKHSVCTFNLSASADFLDKRLSARISISDLFNANRTDNYNTNPYYLTNETTHRDSRYITLGVTYRIGKMDLRYRTQSGAGME